MIYNNLNDQEKIDLLKKLYEIDKISFADIAKLTGTYSNKVRRDAIRLKINIRDKSEAQKNALHSGKTKHPTKGTKRPNETKAKIGESVLKSWESISDEELKNRKTKAKINWENKTDEEKQLILRQANMAVRESSKKGSKLENFILSGLLEKGFAVEFHKEHSILNTKLQIDLFLPEHNIAIEVDGPSHFAPVWGEDALKRNKKYDNKKTGLILGKGLYLIRVKQTKDFSKSRAKLILENLISIIYDIKIKKPGSKTIEIGD